MAGPDATAAKKDELRERLRGVGEQLARADEINTKGVEPYGFGRLDAFGRIDNRALTIADPSNASLSPVSQVERIRRPLFVYAGANDPRVPRAQSDAIVGALRRRGRPVEYMLAAGEGHGFDRRETQIEYCTRVAAFLRRVLGAPPPG